MRQQVDATVRITFDVNATIETESLKPQIDTLVSAAMKRMTESSNYSFISSEVQSIQEEADIYSDETKYIVLGERSVHYLDEYSEEQIIDYGTKLLDEEANFYAWEPSMGLSDLLAELSGWADFREVSYEVAVALGYKEN